MLCRDRLCHLKLKQVSNENRLIKFIEIKREKALLWYLKKICLKFFLNNFFSIEVRFFAILYA